MVKIFIDFPTGSKQKSQNKTVLLCERKRHTTRRVASTRFAGTVGGGYPNRARSPARGRGIHSWGEGGTPARGVPQLGYPHGQPDGVPPPASWMGYPPPRPGGRGTPPASWDGVPPLNVNRHTCENSTFPPYYVRGR